MDDRGVAPFLETSMFLDCGLGLGKITSDSTFFFWKKTCRVGWVKIKDLEYHRFKSSIKHPTILIRKFDPYPISTVVCYAKIWSNSCN